MSDFGAHDSSMYRRLSELHMKRTLLIWAMLVCPFAVAENEQSATMTPADTLEWMQEGGPPFAEAWTDDDGAHGRFVRFPPGFSSPIHIHSHDYHGIVVMGVMDNPMGDEDDAVDLPSGSAYFVPGKAVHKTRCVSDTPCLFYVHQNGPFDLIVQD